MHVLSDMAHLTTDTQVDISNLNSENSTARDVEMPNNQEGSNETSTPPTTATTIESGQSSNKRKKSVVWDHFEPIKKSDGSKSTHASCKYCKKKLSCDARNGISTLARHRCDKHPLSAEDKDKKQKLISSLFAAEKRSGSIGKWKFDQEICRKALAKLIIVDELPFILVSSQTFKDFCWALQPQFHVVSRTTITRDCVSIYLEEKEKLKAVLKTKGPNIDKILEKMQQVEDAILDDDGHASEFVDKDSDSDA